MDFFEAMARMKDGAKVKLKTWPKEQYIGVEEETKKVFGKKVTIYTPIDNNSMHFNCPISFKAFLQHQWEEFSEDSED